MSNARFIIGATGGEIQISESTGVTGATGYGTIYVSSSDNKPHFVNTNGSDSVLGGELQAAGTDSLWTPSLSLSVGTCNSIAIGKNACNTGSNVAGNIAIGYAARNCGTSDFGGGIAIGCEATTTRYNSVAIGNKAVSCDFATAIGTANCATGQASISIGLFALATAENAVSISRSSTASGNNSIAIGCSTTSTLNGIAIGAGAKACATSLGLATAIGFGAIASCVNSTVIGTSSLACHTGAIVFGPSITSERENTVHVNNLLALGQGVSKGHDVGATAGTVTIDWNNSNTQKVTMTGNITSLTLSNPIQGGVYSLIIEQGNASTNAITWPAGAIKWPGGTPPSLTTGATGNTDIVSLIYDPAGGTAYYGNANANFS